jgi:hypothetical protein
VPGCVLCVYLCLQELVPGICLVCESVCVCRSLCLEYIYVCVCWEGCLGGGVLAVPSHLVLHLPVVQYSLPEVTSFLRF